MKILSKEKARILAEKYGWSISRAEGYLEGVTYRGRGKPPTTHAQVGIDDFAKGFRAGYYDRASGRPVPMTSELPATVIPVIRAVEIADTSGAIEIGSVSVQAG